MTFVTVDLLDQDGAVVSTANVEENFWNAYSAQLASWAVYYGFGVNVPGTQSPQINIYDLATWKNWINAQDNTNAKLGKTASAPASTGAVLTLAAFGLLAGAIIGTVLSR